MPRGLDLTALPATATGTRVIHSDLVERHSRPIGLFDRVTEHSKAFERAMQLTFRTSRGRYPPPLVVALV